MRNKLAQVYALVFVVDYPSKVAPAELQITQLVHSHVG